MLPYIATYFGSLLIFVGLDAIWLSLMGPRLYKPLLQDILSPTVSAAPAVIFYIIYISGILLFAVAPWAGTPRLGPALARGAALGLVAYATYDLTNQATLKSWPVTITLADLCWGALVTALAAAAGCLVWNWLAR